MASVGTSGCSFEQPLEAAYHALHDPIQENLGFLRNDAMLLVIFITDEDDCSVDPNSDLFSAAATQYGPLISYRCTQYGISCGGSMLAGGNAGPLDNCAPLDQSAGGKLWDVSRYTNFFTRRAPEGGVKVDPSLVMLASISGPTTPFSTLLAQINPVSTPYQSCSTPGPQCSTVLQHSCASSFDSTAVGDPAVRLQAVVNASSGTNTSICDNDYTAPLTSLLSSLGGGAIGCFPSAPALPFSCSVADVSVNGSTPLPQCNGANQPCWNVVGTSSCQSGWQLSVDRNGAAQANGVTVQANCLLASGKT
jgi:hypothetical protein